MYCKKHDVTTYRQSFCIACVLEEENAKLRADFARVNERIKAEKAMQKDALDTEAKNK